MAQISNKDASTVNAGLIVTSIVDDPTQGNVPVVTDTAYSPGDTVKSFVASVPTVTSEQSFVIDCAPRSHVQVEPVGRSPALMVAMLVLPGQLCVADKDGAGVVQTSMSTMISSQLHLDGAPGNASTALLQISLAPG